jgi:hypothetical protein
MLDFCLMINICYGLTRKGVKHLKMSCYTSMNSVLYFSGFQFFDTHIYPMHPKVGYGG